jgi:hypothetical protein
LWNRGKDMEHKNPLKFSLFVSMKWDYTSSRNI